MTDTTDLRHICASLDALHSEMRAFLNRPGLAEWSILGRHVPHAPQNVELDRIKEDWAASSGAEGAVASGACHRI